MVDRFRHTRFVETATGAFAVALGVVLAVLLVLALFIGLADMIVFIAERV